MKCQSLFSRKKLKYFKMSFAVFFFPGSTELQYTCILPIFSQNTLQPFITQFVITRFLDITQFKDGSQKCIDYIEK